MQTPVNLGTTQPRVVTAVLEETVEVGTPKHSTATREIVVAD